jgi:hypothetical protein
MRAPARWAAALLVAAVTVCAAVQEAGGLIGAEEAAAKRADVPKLIWGPPVLPNHRSAFPIYHHLGVSVWQSDLVWARVAATRPLNPQDPNDPAYRWPSWLDQALSQASRYRIRVCLLVQTAPRWANGGRPAGWAPTHTVDYANFLIAAARRYPSVHLWMIWGEPNRPGNFEPMPAHSPAGPRRYALLLAAGYAALKSVSPANIVIGGDTWSFGSVEPADFVRWMRLPNGQPPPLDYYGHNPFSIRFPQLDQPPYYPGGRDINDIDTLEGQLKGIYHRTVPLWLSEFTVSSDHRTLAFAFSVSRQEQAKWLTAAFRLANSVPYVAGMGWFDLLDDPTWVRRGLTSGLMTWRLKRKPDFYAYEHAP